MAEAENTVVIEPEVKTPEPAAVPTRDELREKGWSAKEMDAAEKRGMIQKPEEQKKEEPKPEPKAEDKPVEDKKAEEKKPEPKRGAIPDFALTPEQEKTFAEMFGPGTPVRGVYFRMKNERFARQAAEAERDRLANQVKELSEKVNAKPPAEATEEFGAEEVPEDEKPLTIKQLREMQRQEQEEARKRQEELSARAVRVTEAQKTQEEYVREQFGDFDETVKLAAEVIKDVDGHVPEKWKQGRVVRMIQELQVAAARADEFGVDDYNAAMIAYEIGQMHPEYGKKTNGRDPTETGSSKDPNKANGGLTAEQMKRIETNTQRRASSAAIPASGGRRVVSVDEVALSDLAKMSDVQRRQFREKYPDRYKTLLRG